ncbi:MAG TPA: ABC transporter ATP-binding protein, partial [Opitutales bacterium]|nr:ABC transporter ATP-binding protein [Opitutales bacterium]
ELTRVVDRISLQVYPGETVGIAGESGSGKSVTAFAIAKLLPFPQGRILEGNIFFEGKQMDTLPPKELQAIRGKDIGFIFQEPMTALNPVIRIGRQITEIIDLHEPTSREGAKRRAVELLQRVGIPDAQNRFNAYAHELSGGMRQRVMIAMALACRPKLLIADEPTTALDVTIQADVLELLQDLQKELGMALMFISHDLGVLSRMCQRLYILYAGQVVESGPTQVLLRTAKHPYTQGLINAVPHKGSQKKSFLKTIPGQPLPPSEWPQGCRFAARCSYAHDKCRAQAISEVEASAGHRTRCVRWDEIELQ